MGEDAKPVRNAHRICGYTVLLRQPGAVSSNPDFPKHVDPGGAEHSRLGLLPSTSSPTGTTMNSNAVVVAPPAVHVHRDESAAMPHAPINLGQFDSGATASKGDFPQETKLPQGAVRRRVDRSVPVFSERARLYWTGYSRTGSDCPRGYYRPSSRRIE